ncbi:peptidoglycan bridge formation glycyltransferase FemA/FemB family protein, partial [Patescibacteria group bacterium]|nr:peptidoglycan bridge formation glycyltransferase FemA/FemB family protein [Patescibacteria group bacterium]
MISIQNIKDKQLWERFILDYQRGVGNPEGGAFLQSLAWEEFQKKLGKEIFRIGLLENDKLVGTSLIILQKTKAASFLYVPMGPIFLKWGKKYFEEWLKYGLGHGEGFVIFEHFVHFHGNHRADELLGLKVRMTLSDQAPTRRSTRS